jgi:hypothetical protein
MFSMRIDPHAQACRLLADVDQDLLPELAEDPETVIPVLFDGVIVSAKRPSQRGRCDVDGTYNPNPPISIEYANDVAPSRQRFTMLHELGHHLIFNDDALNALAISDTERPDESICNEVAASILLPEELVKEYLPAGTFTAENVVRLHGAREIASRAACCVAAVRRLRLPGCVILGTSDGTAEFIAHQIGTPWRIARGTPQGSESLLVTASKRGHARGVTHVTFASGRQSAQVHADAFDAGDGWIFMVVVGDTHSPWEKTLRFATAETNAPTEVVECPRCDKAFTAWWAPCPLCGEVKCPDCKHCGCRSQVKERRCRICTQLKVEALFSAGGDVCRDCE